MEKKIIKELDSIEKQYLELKVSIDNKDVYSNIEKYKEVVKKIKKFENKYNLYTAWKKSIKEIDEASSMLMMSKDLDEKKYLKEVIIESKLKVVDLEKNIVKSLIIVDEDDDKDVVIEIQSATGGDEAKIFVGDMYRMYLKYASFKKWKVSINSEEPAESGGFSYISISIKGLEVYKELKYEGGTHRVQRVPLTETKGRVHTSTITINVIPIYEDSGDFQVNDSDLKMDTYKSGGKGGQHANKTDSAIRITHLPTGLVVQSQEGRSQHHNKDIALNTLRLKLIQLDRDKKSEESQIKKTLVVGLGKRSEKIRTYNYPQNRVTDHRVGLTLNKLDKVINGELDLIISVLKSTPNNMD